MKRPLFIAEQGRRPSGLLGGIVGRIMAHETAPENAYAVDLLELQPCDRVLEIGCGHGQTLKLVAARAEKGFVAGLDHSEAMIRLAERANRVAIRQGRMELKQGDSASLPYPDAFFAKALAVHTIYFWPDPGAHFRQLARVLRCGGRLVLGFRTRDDPGGADFPAEVYRFRSKEEVVTLLKEAGFVDVKESRCPIAERPITFLSASQTS